MTTHAWFAFELEDFATAIHALQTGAIDELDRSVAAGSADPSAASLAGAQASAMMLLSSPHQLWVTWDGGAIAVGQGEEASVVLLTDPVAAATACAIDGVASALDSIDLTDLPSEGRATASRDGEVVAGWSWESGAVMRGVPGVGIRTLAEPAPDLTVHTIVADFQRLVSSGADG